MNGRYGRACGTSTNGPPYGHRTQPWTGMNDAARRDLQPCRRWTPRGGPIEGPLPVGGC
jgi:hypothetical protein